MVKFFKIPLFCYGSYRILDEDGHKMALFTSALHFWPGKPNPSVEMTDVLRLPATDFEWSTPSRSNTCCSATISSRTEPGSYLPMYRPLECSFFSRFVFCPFECSRSDMKNSYE